MFLVINPNNNNNNNLQSNNNNQIRSRIVIIKDFSINILLIILIAWDLILDKCNKRNFIEENKF